MKLATIIPVQAVHSQSVNLVDQISLHVDNDHQTYHAAGIDLEADFRISQTGAQKKTAFLHHNGHWCRPAGAPPTSHLFKLPIGEFA